MILTSNENLQVGDIVGNSLDCVYFRSFLVPEEGNTIIDITLIIKFHNGKFELFRRIDHEVSKLICSSSGVLYALGHFGNLYIYNNYIWNDVLIDSDKSINYLTNLDINGISEVAIGGGSSVLQFVDNKWKKLIQDTFAPKCMLWGILFHSDGFYYVVGEEGLIIKVNQSVNKKIEIPTNNRLLAVAELKDGEIAVCGSKGVFFVGSHDSWFDHSFPELQEDFTDLIFWKNELFISAGKSVLKFDGQELKVAAKIKSLKFFSTGDILWTIGVKSIHYYDGNTWLPFEVNLEL